MKISEKLKSVSPWICLLAAGVFYCVSSGWYNLSITAWIWPACLMYALHRMKVVPGIILSSLIFFAASLLKWNGIMENGFLTDLFIYLLLGFSSLPAFWIDRLMYRRNHGYRVSHGLISTLIFPLAFTSVEYLEMYNPFGPWGTLSHTQFKHMAFRQITSLFGYTSIAFLLAWFASTLVYWVEHREHARKAYLPLMVCMYTIFLCTLWGGLQTFLYPADSMTVRIAAGGSIYEGDWADSRLYYDAEINVSHLQSGVEQGALGNANIMLWTEEAFSVVSSDMDVLLQEAANLAKDYNMYLLLPIQCVHEEEGRDSSNQTVFVSPDRGVEWIYVKKHLVPYVETGHYEVGDGTIYYTDTPYGRISSVICFDLDFPSYMREVGRSNVDILLVPSWDWEAILPYHTEYSMHRAVEQGVNILHVTKNGRSMTVDARGRVLSSVSSFSTDMDSKPLFFDVPTQGSSTLYSRIGDIFPLANLTVLLILVKIGVRKSHQ